MWNSLGRFSAIFMRLALATAFLSAVADRFGVWGGPGAQGVAWGDWASFVNYAGKVNPYLPTELVPAVGAIATAAEVILAILLIAGFRLEVTGALSGALLLLFALGMTLGTGIKSPLDASVFTASAGGFLLSAYAAMTRLLQPKAP